MPELFHRRLLRNDTDFERVRDFLREIFELHGRHELAWHVARIDYWRWHFVENLGACPPVNEVLYLWETGDGRIGAVLHPFGMNEAFLAIHPDVRTAALEHEMIELAEDRFVAADGERRMFIMADAEDGLRRRVLRDRSYERRSFTIHRWWRDLDAPLPGRRKVAGFRIRAMEDGEEPARSWASWRAFHPDDPDDAYEGWEWYRNIQAAPLYRRDLDIVAVAADGAIAAFCTAWHDSVTRSAVLVVVGTAAEYQRRGLGGAVITEVLHRLQTAGATRVFANAYDPPADALYGSVLGSKKRSESWMKRW
jgi:ribosomal protein S18 acetylase RimI-like enzyme